MLLAWIPYRSLFEQVHGTALVGMAENFARARGLQAVRATVQQNNEPSLRLFKKKLEYKNVGKKEINGKLCGYILEKNLSCALQE